MSLQLLAAGVKNALESGRPTKIAVHSETQVELGQRAAQRMGGDRATSLTFVVIPEEEQEQFPVGAILVP
ncbi:MAG: hypothetical protein A2655_03920 [Candidatus Yanofskybacteria bacterium RIFCSPHIGHO2_01_FULL_43_42]|uniref:Uncharacterized protein n=1 Tax=Candidatus Yanofskybacteria bacterium RIFCSPLOWO2_01_FULL_43_22 TaxID=1802695 RepID=A0A1F8GD17_9BACT|nr:MAG: hypothetical protein A2655_03920 [Candidatus Yanofskybacteria bacterium RIFCSPHIGHO2_01_FULL_43_42]OGN12641.1 MAG: hypothetical protein A3D48_01270 [Candidatus Yanofskybacteria bacterium RIFCSPHIGHO2_02_FULL_43_17]OGN23264.1 MAG: hypothetical protein A3A13_04035 [Candidatus Yanofskybacteria bacterium RIFCSPLOWO2_01_FULL_43_22]